MGVDIFGENPSNDKGQHLCLSWWWWRPMATYCVDLAPDIIQDAKAWQANDGASLDGTGAIALADRLEQSIEDGTFAACKMPYKEYAEEPKPWPVPNDGYFAPIPEIMEEFIGFLRNCGGFKIY
jgi:hypothetical protein